MAGGVLRVQLATAQPKQAVLILHNALGQEVRRTRPAAVVAGAMLQLSVVGLPAGRYSATVGLGTSCPRVRQAVLIEPEAPGSR